MRARSIAMVGALGLVLAACTSSSAPAGPLGASLADTMKIAFTGGPPTAGEPFSIVVTNDGRAPHTLAIDHEGSPIETGVLDGGASETLQVPSLPAGSAVFYCSVPGHRAAGMETTLTIIGAGDASPVGAEGPDADAIDEAHRLGIEAFPAKTEGLGGQALAPTIENGVKVFTLTAQAVRWEVSPGEFIDAYGYNGVIPGPQLRVSRGDRVRVDLVNELPESTTIHFHGVTVPNALDGVPFITQDPVKSGETFSYAFTIKDPPGTHMYHSHHNATEQVGKGLLGAFIVEDPKPVWDNETTLVVGDGPLGYTINGKGFPATAPLTAKVGERHLIRFMNEGLQIHPMHLHGMRMRVIAMDGIRLAQPLSLDTVVVAPGQRVDAVATPTLKGIWAFHCHILNHAESPHGMFGMVTAMIVS